jgi:hypothetical protein
MCEQILPASRYAQSKPPQLSNPAFAPEAGAGAQIVDNAVTGGAGSQKLAFKAQLGRPDLSPPDPARDIRARRQADRDCKYPAQTSGDHLATCAALKKILWLKIDGRRMPRALGEVRPDICPCHTGFASHTGATPGHQDSRTPRHQGKRQAAHGGQRAFLAQLPASQLTPARLSKDAPRQTAGLRWPPRAFDHVPRAWPPKAQAEADTAALDRTQRLDSQVLYVGRPPASLMKLRRATAYLRIPAAIYNASARRLRQTGILKS